MQIIIKLTTACNLNCVYCSEGDKCLSTLKKSLAYKLIDDLPAFMEKYHDENIELLWHGGEPLMMGKSYLDDVMSYAKKKLAKYKLKFSIQSNGTLIDEEWIEIFKKYDVGVGISLDGYQEIHDNNRKAKDGEPTFQKIMDNIKKMQSAEITIGTLMVLNTEQEVDVDKLIDVIKKMVVVRKSIV